MPKTAILTDKDKAELVKFLEAYLIGVEGLQLEINQRLKRGEKDSVLKGLNLALSNSAFGKLDGHNCRLLTKETQQIIYSAANILIKNAHLKARVSFGHVVNVLQEELGREYLARSTKKKSCYRVIDNAIKRLTENIENATYIFPIIYTPQSSIFEMNFGPLKFADMSSVEKNVLIEGIDGEGESARSFEVRYNKAWKDVMKRAKHVAQIHVTGYELEMGQVASRGALEFFLNILRLSFKWDASPKIAVLEKNIKPGQTPTLIFIEGGEPYRSIAGSKSEYLSVKEGDDANAVKALTPYQNVIAPILYGMVNNSAAQSVVLRKIEYASFLITTAFGQSSVRIALVNFVAALETLACLGDEVSKKDELARRCGLVIFGLSEDETAAVENAVRQAYEGRNSVVHGDAFDENKHWKPFRDLEEWMLSLVLSYVDLLSHIQSRQTPKSGKKLRQHIRQRFQISDK